MSWGGKWSTPTCEQWEELLDFTSHKWTEQNGVVGFVFISGNTSLFLPAAGNRFRGDLYSAGIYGNYWSSSLYPSYSGYAWGFNFYASSFFTALNNGKVSALISTVRTLVFETAAVFILPALFGVDGIWFAIICAEVLSLALSVAMLKKHRGRYRYV